MRIKTGTELRDGQTLIVFDTNAPCLPTSHGTRNSPIALFVRRAVSSSHWRGAVCTGFLSLAINRFDNEGMNVKSFFGGYLDSDAMIRVLWTR